MALNEEKLIIAKFGGTSMGDSAAMKRSAEVALNTGARLIAVSATSGTTNLLEELIILAKSGKREKAQKVRRQLIKRHRDLACELEVDQQCLDSLEEIYNELKTLTQGMLLLKDCWPKTRDLVLSCGERMSSLLFSQCFSHLCQDQKNAKWIDVRDFIVTDDRHTQARPLFDRIEKNCQSLTDSLTNNPSDVFITQGFIGRSQKTGATTTLGRGGSDYSAALLAWALNADELHIWTDVAGIATTDPRICQNARQIKAMSFQEAAELATFGAKILHPTTLAPAVQKNIPVFVGSSFDQQAGGTWICQEDELAKFSDQQSLERPLVRAMAIRKEQALLTITTPKMLQTHGFLAQIFRVFDEYQVSVDAITTSEISVSLTLNTLDAKNEGLLNELRSCAEVSVENNMEMVSLIGNNIHQTSGVGQQIFKGLGDINVRMVCFGASKHNFCFIVSPSQGEQAIKRLHHFFIEGQGESA